MYKLTILIEGTSLPPSFDETWPQFLHLAEQMPGLRREATSQVAHILVGNTPYSLIHELFFDSLGELQAAMASPPGKQAGQILQRMTGGKIALLVGDHNQDELVNIQKHRQEKGESPSA